MLLTCIFHRDERHVVICHDRRVFPLQLRDQGIVCNEQGQTFNLVHKITMNLYNHSHYYIIVILVLYICIRKKVIIIPQVNYQCHYTHKHFLA